MTEQIHYKKGTVASLDACIEELGLGVPTFSWWEPRPESLIDTELELPLKNTFKTGGPELPDQVEYSEMLLFYPDGSLTLQPRNGGLDYFYWSEESFTDSDSLDCQKNQQRIYPRTREQLEHQYGIDMNNDLFPEKDEKANDKALYLTEYHKDGVRVAWTISTASKGGK